MDIVPGDAVLTKLGTGVVVRCFESSVNSVEKLQQNVGDDDEVGSTNTSNWASIRLCREPGKSIASCSLENIRLPSEDDVVDDDENDNVIIRKICATPGMIVRACCTAQEQEEKTENDVDRPTRLYMIEEYRPAKDVYLASLLDSSDNNGAVQNTEELLPSQIISTSSKFYPMLEQLIERGETAWNLAVEKGSQHGPISQDDVSNVAEKLSSAVTITNGSDESAAKLASDASKSSIEFLNTKLNDNASTLENGQQTATNMANQALSTTQDTFATKLPQPDEIKQIYKMLRDDDLTQLFQRGKERLKELVDVDIPEKTKQTLGNMGIEIDDDYDKEGEGSMRGKIDRLRKDALSSLDSMLQMNIKTDENGNVTIGNAESTTIQINTQNILDPSLLPSDSNPSLLPSDSTDISSATLQAHATQQFTQVFDYLSEVSTSDPQLNQIFGTISEKTKVWQEMTGRLLQTKTASLFVEGGQRLKNRAAEVLNAAGGDVKTAFGSSSVDGVGNSADLTRAFTEGDVAKAKLKSMEMGDAIRSRLFEAIELRSESSGGLDAIIAGSLSKIQSTGDSYTSKAASLLGQSDGLMKDLSVSSEGVSEGDIQSVISNLQQSATSSMKDTKESLIALLSEKSGYRDAVLLRLERTFVDLESELGQDLSAEQIAKLASGEGGSLALFQPIAAKAAKEIEIQLDLAEEKMKGSQHWSPKVDDVMGKVRQITRGELSLMDILDMAAGYLDDEEVVASTGGLIVQAESLLDNFEAASARLGSPQRKGANNKDVSTDIIDAVAKAGITKDTVMKGVEGLDVNKLLDDTQNAMTDEVARRELISSAADTSLDFLLRVLPSMHVPPFDGVRDGLMYTLSNLSMEGFKVKKEDIYIEIAGISAQKSGDGSIPQSTRAVKASELLVIDIKNISATLNDAMWSFEQTYMPYLKGSGKANTSLWDGAIRLKFELRRHVVRTEEDPDTGEKVDIYEPVLCLNDRSCSIGGVELTIQGEGKITWVANKMASLLGTRLRDYVVNVIVDALKNNSGWLIEMLNQNLSSYWPFIMRTASLELDKLPKLKQHHVVKADVDDKQDELELVWRERLPLGLNILTNCESGYLKVIDLPRGTQARKVAQEKQLDPDLFKGSTIVSVNGRRYGPDMQVDLFAALKDPARPKAILFKLASQNDLQQMEKMVQQKVNGSKGKSPKAANNVKEVVVRITDEELGLKFTSHDNFALSVSAFLPDSNGQPQHIEKTGAVMLGDLLGHINGKVVLGEKGEGKQKALSLLEEIGSKRPLDLGFVKPYLFNIVLEKDSAPEEDIGGPSELVLTEVKSSTSSNENRIMLKDFALADGAAEIGGVLVGDNLCCKCSCLSRLNPFVAITSSLCVHTLPP